MSNAKPKSILTDQRFLNALHEREMLVENRINKIRAAYMLIFTVIDGTTLFQTGALSTWVVIGSLAMIALFAGFVLLIHSYSSQGIYHAWIKYLNIGFEYVVFTAVVVALPLQEEFRLYSSEGWTILFTMIFIVINFLSALRHGAPVVTFSTTLTVLANSLVLYVADISTPLVVYTLTMSVLSGVLTYLISHNLSQLFVRFRKRERLMRFLSRDMVRRLDAGEISLDLGGDSYEVSVLVSDIRGFTTLSQGADPQRVVALLNEYLTEMTRVIFENGGTVDKFMGDGILAVFGAPIADPEHARKALQAAVQMQQSLQELNQRWQRSGDDAVRMGIGLHSGNVVAGNIGSPERMEYTVIGDAVNLAARIEGQSKTLRQQILFSDQLRMELPESQETRFVTETEIRGRSGLTRLYTV